MALTLSRFFSLLHLHLEPIGRTARIKTRSYEEAQGREEPMRRLSCSIALSVIALLMLVPTAEAQSQEDQGVAAVPIQDVVSVSI